MKYRRSAILYGKDVQLLHPIQCSHFCELHVLLFLSLSLNFVYFVTELRYFHWLTRELNKTQGFLHSAWKYFTFFAQHHDYSCLTPNKLSRLSVLASIPVVQPTLVYILCPENAINKCKFTEIHSSSWRSLSVDGASFNGITHIIKFYLLFIFLQLTLLKANSTPARFNTRWSYLPVHNIATKNLRLANWQVNTHASQYCNATSFITCFFTACNFKKHPNWKSNGEKTCLAIFLK